MAVLERKREIAYLKCVGASTKDLLILVALESLFICITGSALGTALGVFLSPVFGSIMRKFLVAFVPAGNIASPSLSIILFSFGICVVIGVGCSLYPAYGASKIVPMEVLRNE